MSRSRRSISSPRHIVPDVGIVAIDALDTPHVATAIAPAPVTGIVAMELPARYANIEIRTVAGQTLVTAIEILSPVNKRPGRDAAEAYDRKRRELLRSDAHLLEIDLLRAGQRPALVTPRIETPYVILPSRVERRPEVDLWPLSLRARIPVVPVPLQAPDPDVALDVQAALEQVYRNARYDLRVDYRRPTTPPELLPVEAAWLDEHLRAHGLRG